MSAAELRAAPSRATSWTRAVGVMLVVIAIDQLLKAVVRGSIEIGEQHELLGSFLKLVDVHNEGVAFGFLGGGGAPVLIVTALALALLVGFFARNPGRPLMWLPTGMVLGGALGNLIDRIHQGYVTDFIQFPHFPAFNFADICITLGVVALVLVLDHDARAAAA